MTGSLEGNETCQRERRQVKPLGNACRARHILGSSCHFPESTAIPTSRSSEKGPALKMVERAAECVAAEQAR